MKQLPVILILPFRSLTPLANDQQTADGFSEEVTANLTRFRSLRVLSHLTALHVQAHALDHASIAHKFCVDFVVEGSLRRSSERLRVTVQVTDVTTGEIVLVEQFDRAAAPSDIFDIQDEVGLLIACRVASQHAGVASRFRQSASAGQAQTWDVYAAVTRFYEFYRTYDPAIHLELRDGLPVLLEADPGASDGWAALALVLLEERRYHLNERPGVNAPRHGLEAAKRGVESDPKSGFARMALALCQFHTGDLSGFRESAKVALQLNPGHADILAEIGHCHAFLGDFDSAIPLLNQAIDEFRGIAGEMHGPKASPDVSVTVKELPLRHQRQLAFRHVGEEGVAEVEWSGDVGRGDADRVGITFGGRVGLVGAALQPAPEDGGLSHN